MRYPGWKRGELDIHVIQTGCVRSTVRNAIELHFKTTEGLDDDSDDTCGRGGGRRTFG